MTCQSKKNDKENVLILMKETKESNYISYAIANYKASSHYVGTILFSDG